MLQSTGVTGVGNVDAALAGLIGFITSSVFIGFGLAFYSKGTDKTRSLSNVQIILWTGVLLGSYLALAALKGGFLSELSPNLLGLMGVAAGSFVAAKSTRTLQEDELARLAKSLKKDPLPSDRSGENPITNGLLSEEKDSEHYSIAKLQMFSWTIVSIIIFVVAVAANILSNTTVLPDVGSDMLVLMGVSHGAYVANKIADKPSSPQWRELLKTQR